MDSILLIALISQNNELNFVEQPFHIVFLYVFTNWTLVELCFIQKLIDPGFHILQRSSIREIKNEDTCGTPLKIHLVETSVLLLPYCVPYLQCKNFIRASVDALFFMAHIDLSSYSGIVIEASFQVPLEYWSFSNSYLAKNNYFPNFINNYKKRWTAVT